MPTDHFLELPQLRLHVVDWGGPIGAPAVVLLHGAASNAKMWKLVAPGLAQSFRVLALDQRSHGASGTPADNDFSFSATCADVRCVCEYFGIDRAIVAGHSWGANVALEYAARSGDQTAAVVAIEGGFVGMSKVVSWPVAQKMIEPRRWLGTSLAELEEWARDTWGDLYNAEILDVIMSDFDVRADQTIAPRLAFENQVQLQRAVWEQYGESLYPQVKCPALFLPAVPREPHDVPTQQVLGFKRMALAKAQSLMSQVQVEWLRDSLHDVPLQYPAALVERISAFIHADVM